MSIEFVSRLERTPAHPTDQSSVRRRARAVERAGFDRLLIADPDGSPDNSQLASFVLHSTFSLGVTVSHGVGAMAPLVAAQQFAALDQLSGGRLAVSVQPGSEPIAAGGTPLDHEQSFARADEYLVLLRRLWSNERPFDHEGAFYSLKAGHLRTRPFGAAIPLVLSGLSGTALKVAGRHADVFSLPASTQDETCQTIARIRAAASSCGRANKIGFALDIAPYVAEKRDAARAKIAVAPPVPAATCLVGTPEQVAVALVDFCELGVSSFVVHGLEATGDLALFADKVMPLVRRSADRQDKANEALAAVPLTLASVSGVPRRRVN